MQTTLERQRGGNAIVIPIILRPSLWQDSPIGALKALRKNDFSVVIKVGERQTINGL
jgi:hypothetical protein